MEDTNCDLGRLYEHSYNQMSGQGASDQTLFGLFLKTETLPKQTTTKTIKNTTNQNTGYLFKKTSPRKVTQTALLG